MQIPVSMDNKRKITHVEEESQEIFSRRNCKTKNKHKKRKPKYYKIMSLNGLSLRNTKNLIQ